MFFVTIMGIFCAALSGLLYGKALATKGVTLENFSDNQWRIRLIMAVFSLPCLLIWFFMHHPEFIPLQASAGLPALSWFMMRFHLFFLVFLALQLSFFSPQKRVYPAILVCFLLCSSLGIQKSEAYILGAFPPELITQKKSMRGAILQSTPVTCTPTALANILPEFGRECTEKECTRVLNTRRFGTTEADLMIGLQKFGLNGYRVPVLPHYLQRMNRPAIIKIWNGRARHSLAAYGRDQNGELLYIDPRSGFKKIQDQELEKLLIDGKGVVISSEPALTVNESSPRQLVKAIQYILKQENYLKHQSQIYDLETRLAVSAFQKTYHIAPTGTVDHFTYLLLTGPYLDKHHLKAMRWD